MSRTHRRLVLMAALAATLLAAWFAPEPETEAVETPAKARQVAPVGEPPLATQPRVAANPRSQLPIRGGAPENWLGSLSLPAEPLPLAPEAGSVEAQHAATVAPAPATGTTASPPPISFEVKGLLIDGQQPRALVVMGNDSYAVAAGDLIGDTYLVKSVLASRMDVLYLPLHFLQSVDLPAP